MSVTMQLLWELRAEEHWLSLVRWDEAAEPHAAESPAHSKDEVGPEVWRSAVSWDRVTSIATSCTCPVPWPKLPTSDWWQPPCPAPFADAEE